MDEFTALVTIVVLGLLAMPVGLVVALVQIARLKDRVRRLEAAPARAAPAADATPPVGAMPSVLAEPVAPVAPPADLPETPPPQPVVAASTPWAPGRPSVAPPDISPAPAGADGPAVLTARRASALGDWLTRNWVYAVAALSLMLAGVFLVQYGVEQGLLTPLARVVMALLLGAALVVAGEVVRRRSGDSAQAVSAYVPSTFSGAGLVVMFAAILAANHLYDLIGPGPAFAGLVAVAAVAVVFGWFYGPFLAAVGLIGAGLAPFLVGGSTEGSEPLYAYFLLIATAGLAIDAVRRWAWVSVLALAVGYGGGWLVLAGSGNGAGWFGLMLAAMAMAAILVPCLRLAPDHEGPMLSEAVLSRGAAGWPIFPTRLAAGAVAGTTGFLTFLQVNLAAESLMFLLLLAGLAVVLSFWSAGARALADLALLPAAGFLARLVLEPLGDGPLAIGFFGQIISARPPETAAPLTATMLLAASLAVSLVAAWRSGSAEYRPHWAAGAALFAPLAAAGLEFFWMPGAVMGVYPWALQVMAVAALMMILATRFARSDGEDRRRMAYATLSCLALIALALFLVLTDAALTVALAALIPAAAWLDRRFSLPEMGWFIQAGVAAIGWRLAVDPGLVWAVEQADLWEAVLAYAGAAGAMGAGLWLLAGSGRRAALVFLESGAAAALALLANVLIARWLTRDGTGEWMMSHWAMTLNALPWLILCLTQLYRMSLGGVLRWLRIAIASVAGAIALTGIAAAVFPLNPLAGAMAPGPEGLVHGPLILDTLLAAYGLPAAILILSPLRLMHLPRWVRWPLTGMGAGLAALYVALEIRRFWQGDDLSVPGVSQPELYTYTVAMMVVGAGLLYQSIARRSTILRRVALGVIGVTIAKVFLIDASGLTGLTRVFSFLLLGLALIALAWLDRWAADRAERRAS